MLREAESEFLAAAARGHEAGERAASAGARQWRAPRAGQEPAARACRRTAQLMNVITVVSV